LHDDTATTQRIQDALDELANTAKATDTIFVFFAGHGAFGTDKNYYLATHDVQFADTVDLELRIKAGTGLSQLALVEKFKQLHAERVVFIFNACHSGRLHPKALGTQPRALGKSLPSVTASALLSTGSGRIVMSACKPDQLSNYYPDADLTFFTQALTDGLNGKATPSKGYVSAFSLYTYIYETVTDVAQDVGVSQDPMITVLEGVGPFPVALAPASVSDLGTVAPETLPGTDAVRLVPQAESRAWLTKIENQTLVDGEYVLGDKVEGNKIGQQINMGGGVYVGGSVNVTGGNFVGRDQVNDGSLPPHALDATSLSQRLFSALSRATFTLTDLEDISKLSGVAWHDLQGKTAADKAKALVQTCEAIGSLDKLKRIVSLRRPELKDLRQ
jgi:hypothetical protein